MTIKFQNVKSMTAGDTITQLIEENEFDGNFNNNFLLSENGNDGGTNGIGNSYGGTNGIGNSYSGTNGIGNSYGGTNGIGNSRGGDKTFSNFIVTEIETTASIKEIVSIL